VREQAVEIEVAGLRWSAGAPAPVVVASESRTLFAFDAWEDDGGGRRVAEFVGCVSVRFGFPNDEALHGHPLYDRGLNLYKVHEVVNSHWLEELRAIERHHDMSPAVPFEDARHYVLTFHDSTLEAIAYEIRVLGSYETDRETNAALLLGIDEL
jgi:hypothetical protein